MPYTPANFAAALKLVDDRWVDATRSWQWLMKAKTINVSTVKERRELLTALNETYMSNLTENQVVDGVMLIDTADPKWHNDFIVFQSFLSDRAQAEHKPGFRDTSRGDETVRTDNNLARSWTAALERLREGIMTQKGLTTSAQFNVDLAWA